MDDEQIASFFECFARRLADDASFAPIAEANEADVAAAAGRGRSTTRLTLSAGMRADMVRGLRGWVDQPSGRDALLDERSHEGWRVERRRTGLGVVGFVFEGRPNVFADAAGVVRSGNTVVFRIGSDALGTARAIVDHALAPSLVEAGLPDGAVVLVDSPSRAAGWALFDHTGLSLAVARGSGEAVAQLGAVARQAGTPVSLHGTGGAWMIAGTTVDPERFAATVRWSLDRKVCNTLNVCCIVREQAATVVPRFLGAIEEAAAARATTARLHVVGDAIGFVPDEWSAREIAVHRAEGVRSEPQCDVIAEAALATEWEWEDNPEVSLVLVDTVAEAVELFHRYSPRLVVSLLADDPDEQERFWRQVDSPFVGDGFTRWVDGQYALGTPELGLSNWEGGRLLGRSGVLSGDGVFSVRLRVRQDDPGLHR